MSHCGRADDGAMPALVSCLEHCSQIRELRVAGWGVTEELSKPLCRYGCHGGVVLMGRCGQGGWVGRCGQGGWMGRCGQGGWMGRYGWMGRCGQGGWVGRCGQGGWVGRCGQGGWVGRCGQGAGIVP